jgi:CRISPR-associated endonuclease Csn1
MPHRQPYRLGLDIGTTSIGWCILPLGRDGDPMDVAALGCRVYPEGRDPQTKATLAADRRLARSMRRRRDRFVRRRARLLEALTEAGLMPAETDVRTRVAEQDPYLLRALAVEQPLTPWQVGRVLFHLNQRRGFKSNRRTDGDPKETGKIDGGVKALRAEMAQEQAATLGVYLHRRRARPPVEGASPAPAWVRARASGTGAELHYAFYPHREMVEEEFDAVWAFQAPHHPALMTDAQRDIIRHTIFFQRDLKTPEPGKCQFIDGAQRAPWAHPLAQQFRVYSELAHLRMSHDILGQTRPLSLDERDLLVREIFGKTKAHKPKAKITFTQIRKALKLEAQWRFNMESPERDALAGDVVGARLAAEGCFGAAWIALNDAEQWELLQRVIADQDEAELTTWIANRFHLPEERARKVAKTAVPVGHCRLSVEALGPVVGFLRGGWEIDKDTGIKRPLVFSEAVDAAIRPHSDKRTGELFDRLPYYGAVLPKETVNAPETVEPEAVRFGWIANPTVHIGLGQLRKLVNAIIEKYGPPTEIVVEMARELKQSKEKRDKARKTIAENTRNREGWKETLKTEFNTDDPRHGDMLKMRLWHEMHPDRRWCVFCGGTIDLQHLMSADIEVEHILPFSRSLDNSFANKVLAHRQCNRDKRNRTPFEAFGHFSDGKYAWVEIIGRAGHFPFGKRQRFSEQASAAQSGFLDRQLTDTSYLARIATQYLSAICNPNDIWVVPGRLTGLLRAKWGLNNILGSGNVKNRDDHRHHAKDAFVIGMTSRSILKRVSEAAGRAEAAEVPRLMEGMPAPFARWDLEAFKRRVESVVVSFKPDHDHSGQMHNDTAYGLVGPANPKDGKRTVVHRVPIESLVDDKKLAAVRDDDLRHRLQDAIAAGAAQSLKAPAVLAKFRTQTGIRHVRVLENMQVIPIADAQGVPYKGYKGDSNFCFNVFLTPKGRWQGVVESTFEAYQRLGRAPDNAASPEAQPLYRLWKNDLIAIDDAAAPKGRRILRVVKFSGNTLFTADHNEAGDLKKRDQDKDDPFKYLQKSSDWYRCAGMRPVRVNMLGKVHDPGSPNRKNQPPVAEDAPEDDPQDA